MVTGYLRPDPPQQVVINGAAYLQSTIDSDVTVEGGLPIRVQALTAANSPEAQYLLKLHDYAQQQKAEGQPLRVHVSLTRATVGLTSEDHPAAKKTRDGRLEKGILHRRDEIWGYQVSLTDRPERYPACNSATAVMWLSREPGDRAAKPKLKTGDLMLAPLKPGMASGVNLRVLPAHDLSNEILSHPSAPEGDYQVEGYLVRRASDGQADGDVVIPAWDRIEWRITTADFRQRQDERRSKAVGEIALQPSPYQGSTHDVFAELDALGVLG